MSQDANRQLLEADRAQTTFGIRDLGPEPIVILAARAVGVLLHGRVG